MAGRLANSGAAVGREVKPPARPDAHESSEQDEVYERLLGLVTPLEAKRWLKTPNAIFGGSSPNELLDRGEFDRVLRAIVRLEEGIHV